MPDRHAVWTERIIRLFDRGLALLERRDISLNGKSAAELRRRLAERQLEAGGGPDASRQPPGGREK